MDEGWTVRGKGSEKQRGPVALLPKAEKQIAHVTVVTMARDRKQKEGQMGETEPVSKWAEIGRPRSGSTPSRNNQSMAIGTVQLLRKRAAGSAQQSAGFGCSARSDQEKGLLQEAAESEIQKRALT